MHSLPEASGSRERQHAPPALHYCTMPLPSLQLKKRTCLLQSTDRATMWLRETKLLASVGWKWGCQPFSCRCWQNVMHCRTEIYATCLWQESIPAIAFGSGTASISAADVGKMWCTAEKRFMHIYATCLFKESVFLWKSKLPLYQKLEVPESCSTLHHLIMVASCLQKIELWYPSFELQTIDCDLGCFIQRLLQVNEELSRLSF